MAASKKKPKPPERKVGKVTRAVGGYGLIACDDVPGRDIYYKAAWFQGTPPLQEGDTVTFQLKDFGSTPQAHYLVRIASAPAPHKPPAR